MSSKKGKKKISSEEIPADLTETNSSESPILKAEENETEKLTTSEVKAESAFASWGKKK